MMIRLYHGQRCPSCRGEVEQVTNERNRTALPRLTAAPAWLAQPCGHPVEVRIGTAHVALLPRA